MWRPRSQKNYYNVFDLARTKIWFGMLCEEDKALQETISRHIEKHGRAGAERIGEEAIKTDKEEEARASVDLKEK